MRFDQFATHVTDNVQRQVSANPALLVLKARHFVAKVLLLPNVLVHLDATLALLVRLQTILQFLVVKSTITVGLSMTSLGGIDDLLLDVATALLLTHFVAVCDAHSEDDDCSTHESTDAYRFTMGSSTLDVFSNARYVRIGFSAFNLRFCFALSTVDAGFRGAASTTNSSSSCFCVKVLQGYHVVSSHIVYNPLRCSRAYPTRSSWR